MLEHMSLLRLLDSYYYYLLLIAYNDRHLFKIIIILLYIILDSTVNKKVMFLLSFLWRICKENDKQLNLPKILSFSVLLLLLFSL